jgi:hypothetical protein
VPMCSWCVKAAAGPASNGCVRRPTTPSTTSPASHPLGSAKRLQGSGAVARDECNQVGGHGAAPCPLPCIDRLETLLTNRANGRGWLALSAGQCFHVYTRFQHERLDEFQIPEMLRTPLEELILQIKVMPILATLGWAAGSAQPGGSVASALPWLSRFAALGVWLGAAVLGESRRQVSAATPRPSRPWESVGKGVCTG